MSIDPAWFDHYVSELRHLRDGGAAFARDYPRVAARLGLAADDDGQACPDPHVERLLEGVAFLTARVRHQIDAGYPRFTGHLLERLAPHHAAPVPSVAIVALEPELEDPALAAGPVVPAGSIVTARRSPGDGRECRFRTAHAVRLQPLRVAGVRLRGDASLAGVGVSAGVGVGVGVGATLHVHLETTAGLRCDQLDLDELVWHLGGDEPVAHGLNALMLRAVVGVDVFACGEAGTRSRESDDSGACHESGMAGGLVARLPREACRPCGFDASESLLPARGLVAEGERLLKEYAACPARFLFVRLSGLRPSLSRLRGTAFELRVRFSQGDAVLERAVGADAITLHATPVVNLHRRRADRIALDARQTEFRVVPDRAHPLDHEVHSILSVTGLDRSGTRPVRELFPLHEPAPMSREARPAGYAMRRVARRAGRAGCGRDAMTDDVLTEVRLSLSDPAHAPGEGEVAQLAVEVWCTDRDRPTRLPAGEAAGWRLDADAPVHRVRCLRTPTPSLPPVEAGARSWALLGHLVAGLQGLLDPQRDEAAAARALREHLALHATDSRSPLRRHVDGVLGVRTRAVVRRLPLPGPMVFGRGLSVTLTVDEAAFAGIGPVLLGGVMHRVLASRAPAGGFVELELVSAARGPIARWGPRSGRREWT